MVPSAATPSMALCVPFPVAPVRNSSDLPVRGSDRARRVSRTARHHAVSRKGAWRSRRDRGRSRLGYRVGSGWIESRLLRRGSGVHPRRRRLCSRLFDCQANAKKRRASGHEKLRQFLPANARPRHYGLLGAPVLRSQYGDAWFRERATACGAGPGGRQPSPPSGLIAARGSLRFDQQGPYRIPAAHAAGRYGPRCLDLIFPSRAPTASVPDADRKAKPRLENERPSELLIYQVSP
jgi:hypothetical protein